MAATMIMKVMTVAQADRNRMMKDIQTDQAG